MFRITVDEVVTALGETGRDVAIKRFEQTVDALDMAKLIAAINSKPRKPRTPKVTGRTFGKQPDA